ncbi:MAG: hypothetical protein A2644_03395 [Candidatus Zambryskibacteria bacterium RIFCSPHIGHO2_01_FULL_39_63]|nr:MAG: hypothetical protein UT00_C0006G0018 [Parcubacteria group bacterium GW2011_GWA1_38_7]OHA87075.1 MAG: hypothetical protein A2644_03395 [Candidatus Zambryskibacteria bacterium RIFCSPHIGHO2_01_FULL_39_63]OHA94616.1 MAG: hypothetical protein A3B88_00200 [Candidatus Zambryskibacteria bacterium RIFCSPHIGHO2_02_FULL_39_19]OHA98067.1 MAG: hypothetical protein A3F20_01100 [Candidatus Zambryskibacteria bacterium RIFCSPHIGHO2_12_FULL_39_21]
MDTFNPNQMPPMQSMQSEPNKKSAGPLIAVIIILALIIIGGLYFLKERSSQEVYIPTTTSDSITDSLNEQSDSDDLNSIEADLNATNLDNLDQGAAAIEAELQ